MPLECCAVEVVVEWTDVGSHATVETSVMMMDLIVLFELPSLLV